MNSLQFTPYLVCFMDVLGFKGKIDVIKSMPAEQEKLLKTYFLEGDKFGDIVKGEKSLDGFELQIRIISDSIILTLKIGSDASLLDCVKSMCIAAGRFQAMMSENNLWLRGAICLDGLYESGQIVVGPALIRAFLLEQKYACYPRVIIDPKLVKRIGGQRKFLNATRSYMGEKWRGHVVFDADTDASFNGPGFGDFLFVDYFSAYCAFPMAGRRLESAITHVAEGIYSDPGIMEKFKWVQRYLLEKAIRVDTCNLEVHQEVQKSLGRVVQSLKDM